MNNFGTLLKGEFQRLSKYKIMQAGIGVSLLWVATLFLIGPDDAGMFLPLFVFMDVSLMTVLLIGSGLFYERQENTLKTLLITPTKFSHIIYSKLITAVIIALQSALILGLLGYFFFDVGIQFHYLIAFTVLISFMHAMLGFVFAVLLKDFPSLLASIMLYMIVFAFPSIFYALDILSTTWSYILIISPTHASMLLVELAFGEPVNGWMIVVSIVYLIVITLVFAKWIVFPNYFKKAIED